MGLFSKKKEAKQVSIKGQKLKCVVCNHDKFTFRTAQLNTSGMTSLGLDWLNDSAYCYVCENYTYIHWFTENNN